MNRQAVGTNSELYVELDRSGLVNNLSFLHIGHGQLVDNSRHKIGVRVDGATYWVDDASWSVKTRHDRRALVVTNTLINKRIGILLEIDSFVSVNDNVFIRNIHIVNLDSRRRSVSLFMHQAFMMEAPRYPDTAQLLPGNSAVIHYAGRRAIVASGMTDMGQPCDQYSIGLFGDGREGTWRDADDGELSGSTVATGQVDSTLRFSLTIGGLSSRRLYYWLAASTSSRSAIRLSDSMSLSGIYKRYEDTIGWWRKWLGLGFKMSGRVVPKYRQVFTDSLAVIRSQIDVSGAVVSITAVDSRLPLCSPHKSAYALWPLARLGYSEDLLRFFAFCRAGLADDGCLLPGYRADGAVASTRLPYIDGVPPINSADTATVLFLFSQYQSLSNQSVLLKNYFSSFVEPMASFLASFTRDDGLPGASYSTLDGVLDVSTYTSAVTYAALMAAADMAESLDRKHYAVRWRTAADDVRRAVTEMLCSPGDGSYIYNSLNRREASIESFHGMFMFGIVSPDAPVIITTARMIEERLRRSSGLFVIEPGSSRVDYKGSLWMAQYYMEIGRLNDADNIIQQVVQMLDSDEDLRSSMTIRAELVSTLLDSVDRS